MALNNLICADVLLRNYSRSSQHAKLDYYYYSLNSLSWSTSLPSWFRLFCLYHVLPELAFRYRCSLSSTDAYNSAMDGLAWRAVTTAKRLSDQRWRHVKRGSLNSSVYRPTRCLIRTWLYCAIYTDVIYVCTDVQYRVEPREVKARLDSPAVVSVLSMGYPRDLIRQAIERRLTTTGLFNVFL